MINTLLLRLARFRRFGYHKKFANWLKKSVEASVSDHAWVVERSKATGCKPVGLISYVGSNPTPCTIFAGVAQLVERQPSKLNVASSSLVSRSKVVWKARFCPSSSGVERFLGKEEVPGSNPGLGSRLFFVLRFQI